MRRGHHDVVSLDLSPVSALQLTLYPFGDRVVSAARRRKRIMIEGSRVAGVRSVEPVLHLGSRLDHALPMLLVYKDILYYFGRPANSPQFSVQRSLGSCPDDVMDCTSTPFVFCFL